MRCCLSITSNAITPTDHLAATQSSHRIISHNNDRQARSSPLISRDRISPQPSTDRPQLIPIRPRLYSAANSGRRLSSQRNTLISERSEKRVLSARASQDFSTRLQTTERENTLQLNYDHRTYGSCTFPSPVWVSHTTDSPSYRSAVAYTIKLAVLDDEIGRMAYTIKTVTTTRIDSDVTIHHF